MDRPKFDIAAAFRNKQEALNASFLAIRDVTSHPTTIGDQSEGDWVGLIRDFLPTRYTVGPIFAVDHTGSMSEQIDVAIYDTHFSPQWFGGTSGTRFVPVESVYAVFEVKPEFNSEYLAAAQKKVKSVRDLDRTSAPVVHKGGTYSRQEISLRPIIGGILTTRQGLADPVAKLLEKQKESADEASSEFLNIGICLEQFAFDYTPMISEDPNGENVVTISIASTFEDQLIYFAIRLFRQLQVIGSVPAVDMIRYEERAICRKIEE